ncbi:MAG: 16S rRNA (cytidine(1402)-2'-O)-methyltransferase [Candidatus Omnitrophica bacterium]|nr:16S rRNA (cytidine(1402)-2'-O)-methyltransferase [Candidatus Omnitrophota bacterium]
MVDSPDGILYLVATPIGNLGDMTFRAVEVLKAVDFILCEDTRRSGVLLKHFEIKKPLRSFHDHTSETKRQTIVSELMSGTSAAIVSDAGTPLISDPGFDLVRDTIRAGVRVETIPGPSAFVSALVLSGLPVHAFTFAGYLPPKEKAKREALARLAGEPRTLIFYESPHRLLKTLKAMREVLGDRKASVSRELTKKFEETVRGKLSEIFHCFEKRKILGEWTIVIAGEKDE